MVSLQNWHSVSIWITQSVKAPYILWKRATHKGRASVAVRSSVLSTLCISVYEKKVLHTGRMCHLDQPERFIRLFSAEW